MRLLTDDDARDADELEDDCDRYAERIHMMPYLRGRNRGGYALTLGRYITLEDTCYEDRDRALERLIEFLTL